MDSVTPTTGIVNADIEAQASLHGAHVGSSVVYVDSIEYAAAVADKTQAALASAGESVASASRKSGIPRSTLDRKFNSGKGIQALNVRELYDLAKVAGTSASALATVYALPAEDKKDAAA